MTKEEVENLVVGDQVISTGEIRTLDNQFEIGTVFAVIKVSCYSRNTLSLLKFTTSDGKLLFCHPDVAQIRLRLINSTAQTNMLDIVFNQFRGNQ